MKSIQTWQREEPCPFCEQGSALSLYRCPSCEQLSIICEEAGCIFPDPANLANGAFAGYFDEGAKCPHCRSIPINELLPATLAEIERSGVKLGRLTSYWHRDV